MNRLSSALRSLTGSGLLVARRRAARDSALLVAWVGLVAFAMFLAIATPRFVVATLDRAAQQAVAAAGSDADIVVSTHVGVLRPGQGVPPISVAEAQRLARTIPEQLPSAIRQVVGSTTLVVIGPPTQAAAINGVARVTAKSPMVRIGMLTPANNRFVEVSTGRLPRSTADGQPVEVVLSAAAAQAASVTVGDTVTVATAAGADTAIAGNTVKIMVVGIVAKQAAGGEGRILNGQSDRDPAARQDADWRGLSSVWRPVPSDSVGPAAITVLATPQGITQASQSYTDTFDGTVTVRLAPRKFTSALEARVAPLAEGLQANPDSLLADTSVTVQVQTSFADALEGFPGQARAALAQMSLMVAGLLGVAAAVVILVSRLLALRRVREIALERARGASLSSIALRALLESLVLTAIGSAMGIAIAQLVQPGHIAAPMPAIAVAVAAVLAGPTQAVLSSRSLWAGRRAPANRRDRQQLVANANGRRIAVEVTLVAIAAAALVSLATRGLLQTSTKEVDPLLAAAPVLFAIAVTVVVLRLYRWPVRLFGRMARSSRGALGLVSAVRAERSVAALPLLALSLAVSITVTGGLLTETVRSGQVDASWARVGADSRVQGVITPRVVRAVGDAKGVEVAAAVRAIPSVQLSLGTTVEVATVLAIDGNYPKLVDALPKAQGVPRGEARRTLSALDSASSVASGDTGDSAASAPIPVVVDASLARRILDKKLTVSMEGNNFALQIVGTTRAAGPDGYHSGPYVYLDLATLSARTPKAVQANTLLVLGPGAARAVAAQGFTGAQVLDRASWLDDRRQLALVGGVQQLVLSSAIAVALLALIALLSTVIASSRDRVRSVSLLRTLGAPARYGWWLALAELAPTVIFAMVGGVASGALLVVELSPVLGLQTLTGGLDVPPPVVPAWLIGGLVAAAVASLFCAALTEVLVHRRDRLGDVLRVGETV